MRKVEEHLAGLFEKTNAKGKLVIPAWPYREDEECKEKLRLTMNWTREDAEMCAEDCKNLTAELLSELSDDDIQTLVGDCIGAALSENSFEEYAVFRALRINALFRMDAPKMLIKNEALLMGEAMALHRFSVA